MLLLWMKLKMFIWTNQSQGPRFHNTSKVTLKERSDGTSYKHVQKGTFVDLTTRNRKRSGGNEENVPPKLSAQALRHKADVIGGALDIISDKDSNEAATILSKHIDKRGNEFAKELLNKSKAFLQ